MVQLKVWGEIGGVFGAFFRFQFLMVQLKDRSIPEPTAPKSEISIPYGSIKSR